MLVIDFTAFASLPLPKPLPVTRISMIWVRLDSVSARIWKEIDINPTEKIAS